MSKYILAHDLGTSGNKATIYNLKGELCASETYNYDTYYPQSSYVEQDSKDWYRAVCESTKLLLEKGNIDKQKITAYGETKVNTLEVNNTVTKITAYGEGSYRVNVSEELKVTAYGEATIAYLGNPNVSKGIIIGKAIIQKI